MGLNQSMIKIKNGIMKDILSGKIKMTGSGAKNSFYQLSDFMPRMYELMLEEEVNDRFYIIKNQMFLEFIKGDEKHTIILPYHQWETPVYSGGKKSMQDIQYQGALYTYNRRYAYTIGAGIPNNEVIDEMGNGEKTEEQLAKEMMMEFTIACKKREIDSKVAAQSLGLKKSSTKEEWAIAITHLDSLKQTF